MAKRLFEQPSITLNSYEVGADVPSLELMLGRRPPVDVTGLSNTYDEFLVPNLRNWGVRINYFNNNDGTSQSPTGITTVLRGIFNSTATTGVSLVFKLTTAVQSVGNPTYTGQVQIDGQFTAAGGDVAEADKGSVALKGLGTLTVQTSST